MKRKLTSGIPDKGSNDEKKDDSVSTNLFKAPSNVGISESWNDSSRSNSPGAQGVRRPRRATSQNVDYDLKKRRIIPSEDYFRKEKTRKDVLAGKGEDNFNYRDEETQEEGEPVHKEVIEHDENGDAVYMNEPEELNDAVNGATGLPLSQGPPEKVKKESLWNYKKNLSSPESYMSLSTSEGKKNLELKIYRPMLKTGKSESITRSSSLRERLHPKDIHDDERDELIKPEPKKGHDHHGPSHIKIKATVSKETKSKLFGQNSLAHLVNTATRSSPRNLTPTQEVENDDFCSSCLQSGSFLCCDTCPKSFHFLCLNPPLDADNLPEGDWSCPQCTFKQKHQNLTQIRKSEKEFIRTELPPRARLFGKLLFQLEASNPKQFSLPPSIKDSFQHVRSGSRGQYCDEREKEPLTEKQLFGSAYGQCISKLDRYNPDIHLDPDTGKILICYKCGTTKMGTWDDPDTSRLIMRCDYCKTPWHLDCLPNVPRASLKNLGTNWKCPLHAPARKEPHSQRRLAKHQKVIEPYQSCGFRNNGEVDIILDEITAPASRGMIESLKKSGDFPPISLLRERSVKLDFLDKVFQAKKVQRENEFKCQERLIDRLILSSNQSINEKSNLQEIMSLVYFTMGAANPPWKKLWDFKELCSVAQQELDQQEFARENITDDELRQLSLLKKLLESRPKEDICKILNIKQ